MNFDFVPCLLCFLNLFVNSKTTEEIIRFGTNVKNKLHGDFYAISSF